MKFLKKIFSLNGRLDRKGYLFFGVLPMLLYIALISIPFINKISFPISLGLLLPILILILVSTIKRGRDSGLSGLLTSFLFLAIPVMSVVAYTLERMDGFNIFYLFIAYLLLMPSSSKELKTIGIIDYVFTLISILIVAILFSTPLIMKKFSYYKVEKSQTVIGVC